MEFPNLTAAASLIAATTGVVSSVMLVLNFFTARRKAIEEIRPILGPINWHRPPVEEFDEENLSKPGNDFGDGAYELVSFGTLQNVGKGSAHEISIRTWNTDPSRGIGGPLPKFASWEDSYFIGVMRPGDANGHKFTELIDWSKEPSENDDEYMPPGWHERHLHLFLSYLDSQDTLYKVHILYRLQSPLMCCGVAPSDSVVEVNRRTMRCPLWWAEFRNWYQDRRKSVQQNIRRSLIRWSKKAHQSPRNSSQAARRPRSSQPASQEARS